MSYVTNFEFPQVGASGVRIISERCYVTFKLDLYASKLKIVFKNPNSFPSTVCMQSEYTIQLNVLVVTCMGYLLDVYIPKLWQLSQKI